MAISDETDEQLIQKVAGADPQALEQLFDRYAPTVMGLGVNMLGDRQAAEDIVQETFWRVWRKSGTYRPQRGSCSSWLLRIARNLAIDRLRKNRSQPQTMADDAGQAFLEKQPDPGADVQLEVWTGLRHERVQQALAALPPEQRQVIELSYFNDLTRQEIAAQTGVPLGTVHTRARLALNKLRQALKGADLENE